MAKKITKKLKPQDFEKMFGDKFSSYLKKKIIKYNFQYQELTEAEKFHYIRRCIDVLLDKNIVKAGKHRIKQWEKGWGENYSNYLKNNNIDSVSPGYFGKYNIVRINQKYIRAISKNFEKNTLSVIIEWLADKYMKSANHIYEFGCGTGHHLLKIREYNKKAELYGLDWAKSSQKIINQIVKNGFDKNIKAHRFDFFHPDKNFKINKNSVIYTVAALEQTGNNYKKFINYLLSNKPDLCINIEPISELLDEANLLDYLSIRYFEKRNYLKGFYNHLKNLENNKKIKILNAQRSFIGSLFIDGYSAIVWKIL